MPFIVKLTEKSIRSARLLLLALSAFSIPALCQNMSDVAPSDIQSLTDGFYYKTQEGWVQLQPTPKVSGGFRNEGTMFIRGLTLHLVFTYRGGEAPIQISERRPIFLVKELPARANVARHSGKDLVIVRLDKKEDCRELQTTSDSNVYTFKTGLREDRTPHITVRAVSDGVFEVRPNKDLPLGEYLLTFRSMGPGGYDFGIK